MEPVKAKANMPLYAIVAEAEVTERLVRDVMKGFYADVRSDLILGPIFRKAIKDEEWDAHIEKVTGFWLTAFRIEKIYRARNFIPSHVKHNNIGAEHTHLWLEIFERTITSLCSNKEQLAFRSIAIAMLENLNIAFDRRDSGTLS